MAIEVILREEVDNLGIPGDVVRVAGGYARNFLLPRNLAVVSNESNKKIVAQQREAHLRREVTRISEAEELKTMMSSVALTFKQKAGDNDHLFGSVTSLDIVAALDELGYKVDKKQVRLNESIKMLGDYTVTVKLHREVNLEVPVTVLNEDGTPAGAKQAAEEAAEQARLEARAARQAAEVAQAQAVAPSSSTEAEEEAEADAEESDN